MNTQGWIRAIMAKNMGTREFFEHVVECLGREFELEASMSDTAMVCSTEMQMGVFIDIKSK